MTARTGQSAAAICRHSGPHLLITVTIWSSPLTAARSGCSMTSSPLRQANASSPGRSTTVHVSSAIRTRMGTPNAAATPSEKSARTARRLLLFERGSKDPSSWIAGCPGKVIRAFTSEEKKKEGGSDSGKKMKQRSTSREGRVESIHLGLAVRISQEDSAAVYDEGEPSGPLVLPGNYQVRLTVGAKNFTLLSADHGSSVKTSPRTCANSSICCSKCATPGRNEQSHPGDPRLRAVCNRSKKASCKRPQSRCYGFHRVCARKSAPSRKNYPGKLKSQRRRTQLPHKTQQKLGYLANAVDSAGRPAHRSRLGVYAELDNSLNATSEMARRPWRKMFPSSTDHHAQKHIPLIAASAAKPTSLECRGLPPFSCGPGESVCECDGISSRGENCRSSLSLAERKAGASSRTPKR